jgi:hypothetical protein
LKKVSERDYIKARRKRQFSAVAGPDHPRRAW